MIDERACHRGGGAQTARADPVVVQRCRRGRRPGGVVGAGLPSTTVVAVDQGGLSIGSNLGDRMARLQSVVDALGAAVCAVSPVYETDPWAVSIRAVPQCGGRRDDPDADGHDWLGGEPRTSRVPTRGSAIGTGGPRTLDVDLVSVRDSSNTEVFVSDDRLSLPHPLAHLRAFVMIPWLAVEPDAELTVAGVTRPVGALIAAIGPAEHAGVRPTDLTLRMP